MSKFMFTVYFVGLMNLPVRQYSAVQNSTVRNGTAKSGNLVQVRQCCYRRVQAGPMLATTTAEKGQLIQNLGRQHENKFSAKAT